MNAFIKAFFLTHRDETSTKVALTSRGLSQITAADHQTSQADVLPPLTGLRLARALPCTLPSNIPAVISGWRGGISCKRGRKKNAC